MQQTISGPLKPTFAESSTLAPAGTVLVLNFRCGHHSRGGRTDLALWTFGTHRVDPGGGAAGGARADGAGECGMLLHAGGRLARAGWIEGRRRTWLKED